MLECTFDIIGIAPYSQSRPIQSKKKKGEADDVFEERCWRERMHTNGDGGVVIPPMSIKNCLAEAAKFKSEQIPGKGKQTWTKHFEAGVMCVDAVPLGIKAEDVPFERLFLNADGKVGSGTRVWRMYPLIVEWSGTAKLFIVDDVLIQKPDKIAEMLKYAGQLIGLGRFRPRNRGYYGRFKIANFETSETE